MLDNSPSLNFLVQFGAGLMGDREDVGDAGHRQVARPRIVAAVRQVRWSKVFQARTTSAKCVRSPQFSLRLNCRG